jgi:hypothetical protein
MEIREGHRMKRVKLAIALTVVVIGLGGILAGSYILGLYTLHQNNRNWCSALEVLTAVKQAPPADPTANPSRVETYELYTDFMAIEKRFGC